jgi:lysophospholipase L1-like esterase
MSRSLSHMLLTWSLLFSLPTLLLAASADHCYLQPGDTVLCIGDSITAQGVYEAYLQQAVDTLYPGAGITFVNKGQGGARMAAAVPLLTEGLKAKPTLAFIMFGVNDTVWRLDEQEKKILAHVEALRKALVLAKENGVQVVLLKESFFSHNAAWAGNEAELNRFLDRMLAAAAALAAEQGVPVIDLNGAYGRALSAAWAADPRYEFTPDFVHPTEPGFVAMAGELQHALGIGRPLAAQGARGPLQLTHDGPVVLQTLDDVGVLEGKKDVPLRVLVRNTTGAPIAGTLQLLVAGIHQQRPVRISGFGSALVELPVAPAKLAGRWGMHPAYLAFNAPGVFVTRTLPFHYSRIQLIAGAPLAIAAAEFTTDGKLPCPLTQAAVQRTGSTLTITFTWTDATRVPTQPGTFPNPYRSQTIDTPLDLNQRGPQPCDAVEFLLDTRPLSALGRITANTDSNPEGVVRLGVYFATPTEARVQSLPALPADAVTLTHMEGDRYRLTVALPPREFYGFSSRVTDTKEFGLGKGQLFRLTATPKVTDTSVSYRVLGEMRAGLMYRIGY